MISRAMPSKVALPLGFEAALESLAREILRQQPPDELIYRFAADHFEALICKRDENAHSTGLSPSPSAAAASTTGKPSAETPPGSNGHAESSPLPPRPPPKKSHGEPKVDPSLPPALPPKRHSKASSGSQTLGKETSAGPEGKNGGAAADTGRAPSATEEAASKTDASSSGRGSAVMTPNLVSPPDEAKSTPPGSSSTPVEVVISPPGKETISPEANDSENVCTASPVENTAANESAAESPPNNTVVSEATDTSTSPDGKKGDAESPTGTPSSLKRDEESIEMTTMEKEPSSKEEKSPEPGDGQVGGSRDPTPPARTGSSSVVISPPGDPETATARSPEISCPSRGDDGSEDQRASVASDKDGKESVNDSAADSTPAPVGVPLEEATRTVDSVPSPSRDTPKYDEEPAEGGKRETPGGSESVASEEKAPSEAVVISPAKDRPTSGGSAETEIKSARPTSATSEKEIESTSVVSGSIATDSAIVEDKETSSSEAVTGSGGEEVRISDGVEEGGIPASPGEKGRDSGLSSEGAGDKDDISQTTAPIDRADSQGPAATNISPEAGKVPETAALEVQPEVNKNQGNAEETTSPITKGEEASPALDECGNFVVKDVTPLQEEKEGEPLNKESAGGETETAGGSNGGQEIEREKSFGFANSGSLDTVVHVKTEGSTELPSSLSQEKIDSASQGKRASLLEESLKSVEEEMPTKGGSKASSEPEGKVALVGEDVTAVSTDTEAVVSPPAEEPKESTADKVLPPEEEKASTKEEAVVSPTDKSEPSSEELPPPPSPPPDKIDQDKKEDVAMPIPPPPAEEEEQRVPPEQPSETKATAVERPISATEAEVASILLGKTPSECEEKPETTEEAKEVVREEGGEQESEEQKDLPPPPTQDPTENQETDFPPPPDISEDGEIKSPVDTAENRTRSASFELVEILNLRGSLEEGEGEGEKEYREGRGLVKRVPTPVNSDWPQSQEEDDDERESISPEATATPSVTSESKQSLEEEGVAKLPKDNASGSTEGNSEMVDAAIQVPKPSGVAEEIASPANLPVEAQGSEAMKEGESQKQEKVADEVKESATTSETHPAPQPSAPEQENLEEQGSDPKKEGEEKNEVIEVPECVVTNQGPPQEVLDAMAKKLEEERGEKEGERRGEEEEGERVKSAEEERKEVEEVGRKEVDDVLKKAVEEAERRDRESRMSGAVDDEDTVVVEAEEEKEAGGGADDAKVDEPSKGGEGEAENEKDGKEDKVSKTEEGKDSPDKEDGEKGTDKTEESKSGEILNVAEVKKAKENDDTNAVSPTSPSDEKQAVKSELPAQSLDRSEDDDTKHPESNQETLIQETIKSKTEGLAKDETKPEKVAALENGQR